MSHSTFYSLLNVLYMYLKGLIPVIECPRQGMIVTNMLQPQATSHGTIQLLYTY